MQGVTWQGLAGKKPGRPRKWSLRQLIDGIRRRTRTGSPWRDVRELYGPWQSVYGLFRRWQLDGTWAVIVLALQALADDAGHVTWDGQWTRAPRGQHAAGARKNLAAQKEPPGPEQGDHRLGRSRGGLTTKFHLAVDQGQKPLAVIVTAGQRGDSPQFIPVLEKMRPAAARRPAAPYQAGPGPRGQGVRVARQPEVPAPPRDPLHHPREEGPAREPEEEGQLRRPPVRLRHGEVQAAARGGVRRDQPAQAQPCRRHPLDKLAVRYEATTLHGAAIGEWLRPLTS